MVSGCSSTGLAHWVAMVKEEWARVAADLSVSLEPPPSPWLEQHHLSLLAAVLPASLLSFVPLPAASQSSFLQKFQARLAAVVAEWLRRREELIASAPLIQGPPPSRQRPEVLPPERRLSPAELCHLESQRRAAASISSQPSPAAAHAPAPPAAPAAGEARRRWLR